MNLDSYVNMELRRQWWHENWTNRVNRALSTDEMISQSVSLISAVGYYLAAG